MTTIQETVQSALRQKGLASYISEAGPIISLLEDREREISERLLDFAADLGGNTDDVRDKLTELGMTVPDVEDDEDDDDMSADETDVLGRVESALLRVEESFGRINERLGALEETARRYGARL